eukprot:2819233-Rhodomonas_salina.2
MTLAGCVTRRDAPCPGVGGHGNVVFYACCRLGMHRNGFYPNASEPFCDDSRGNETSENRKSEMQTCSGPGAQ